MKKKLVMKKWVEKVLLGLFAICIFIAMSESKDELVFIISHLFVMIMLIFIGFMFMFYGREGDE